MVEKLGEFLGYLSNWDEWVESIQDIPKADRAKLKLSAETLEGWRLKG